MQNAFPRLHAYVYTFYIYTYIPPSSLYIVYMCILCISGSKSMPTRALSGIREVILRNPEGLHNVTECIHEKARLGMLL